MNGGRLFSVESITVPMRINKAALNMSESKMPQWVNVMMQALKGTDGSVPRGEQARDGCKSMEEECRRSEKRRLETVAKVRWHEN